MSGLQMEMTHCEMVILQDIEAGLNQTEVAKSYALALRSSWDTDWKKVNEAIIARWSPAGLERIKRLAWSGKCFNAKES